MKQKYRDKIHMYYAILNASREPIRGLKLSQKVRVSNDILKRYTTELQEKSYLEIIQVQDNLSGFGYNRKPRLVTKYVTTSKGIELISMLKPIIDILN